MTEFFFQRMDEITEEFLSGVGDPAIYESQFLVYLECYVYSRGADSDRVWSEIRKNGSAFSKVTSDRQDLVDKLAEFKNGFVGPIVTRKVATEKPKWEDEEKAEEDPLLRLLRGD